MPLTVSNTNIVIYLLLGHWIVNVGFGSNRHRRTTILKKFLNAGTFTAHSSTSGPGMNTIAAAVDATYHSQYEYGDLPLVWSLDCKFRLWKQ